jgi:hypothetical protein
MLEKWGHIVANPGTEILDHGSLTQAMIGVLILEIPDIKYLHTNNISH